MYILKVLDQYKLLVPFSTHRVNHWAFSSSFAGNMVMHMVHINYRTYPVSCKHILGSDDQNISNIVSNFHMESNIVLKKML